MNTQRCITSTRIVATACVLALVLGCSSDDPPFKPKPVHYNIYAAGSWYGYAQTDSSTMYVYDADSLMLIDSLVFPHIADEAVASPDGRYLYIVFWRYYERPFGRYIAKFDLTSRTVLWTHDPYGDGVHSRLHMLDKGGLLVYGREVIDAGTGETVRALDDLTSKGWSLLYGPSGGTEVAAVEADSVTGISDRIMAVDIVTGEDRGEFPPRLGPDQPVIGTYTARLHPDGRRVLTVGPRSNLQDAWFLVGDLVSGELLMAAQLSTPFAQIAISEDGALAVVADQGNPGFGYGWPAIYVYDLVNYRKLKVFDPQTEIAYWPGRLRFLPGDRRVAAMPDNNTLVTGWVQTFDLESLTPEFVVDTPWFEPFQGAFAVGPRPEQ